MSGTGSLASLESFGGRLSVTAGEREGTRAYIALVAFIALALFGVIRWGTLLTPAPQGRLLGLVALGGVIAGGFRLLPERRRGWALTLLPAALALVLLLSGVPTAWIVGVRISVIAHWIGEGLQALPAALIPYEQADPWVPVVIVLGAGILLLSAALLFAFAPPSRAGRAAAAIPLLVLVSVPAMLMRPQLPYLQGLILLALLGGLVWGDRLRRGQAPAAVALIVAAGSVSMVLAPRLDSHRSWIDVQSLAGALAPRAPESFIFNQSYGPLHWPRVGREVLDVRAAHPDYWKVEDLNLFDGRGFVAGAAPPAALPPAAPAVRARFTQTIQVTIRGLQSSQVIAAGSSTAPDHLSRAIDPGLDSGTWLTASPLRPGDSYTTSTFSPQPSGGELARAGTGYPEAALAAYRTLLLPTSQGTSLVLVRAFHGGSGPDLQGSPYETALRMARRMAQRAPSPYAFVQRVMALLAHGYTYDENTPVSRLPLLDFLFRTHRGYCQQFSGAMALLLRLGGLPARVAGGFTPGVRDRAGGPWIVSDLDAHDWVEVWFPRFGWVRFDPTPAVAPARAGTEAAAPLPLTSARGSLSLPRQHRGLRAPAPELSHPVPAHPISGLGSSPWLISLAVTAIVLGGLSLLLRPPPAGEELLRELEQALRRSRRPAAAGETLREIERRVRPDVRAAAYIRGVRQQRYSQAPVDLTSRDRRALRAQLRAGLGPAGRLVALWALPPRRMR